MAPISPDYERIGKLGKILIKVSTLRRSSMKCERTSAKGKQGIRVVARVEGGQRGRARYGLGERETEDAHVLS